MEPKRSPSGFIKDYILGGMYFLKENLLAYLEFFWVFKLAGRL